MSRKRNFHFLRLYIKYSNNETILFFNKTKPTSEPTNVSTAAVSASQLTISTVASESPTTILTTQMTMSTTYSATEHHSTTNTTLTEVVLSNSKTEFTTMPITPLHPQHDVDRSIFIDFPQLNRQPWPNISPTNRYRHIDKRQWKVGKPVWRSLRWKPRLHSLQALNIRMSSTCCYWFHWFFFYLSSYQRYRCVFGSAIWIACLNEGVRRSAQYLRWVAPRRPTPTFLQRRAINLVWVQRMYRQFIVSPVPGPTESANDIRKLQRFLTLCVSILSFSNENRTAQVKSYRWTEL